VQEILTPKDYVEIDSLDKPRHATEEEVQCALMDWCRFNPPLLELVIHIPNQGKRSKSYGAKLKKMGLRVGASDLFIMRACRGYHGAFIELKSARGIVSPAQKEFLRIAEREKYFTAVCSSIEDCIETVIWYMGIG